MTDSESQLSPSPFPRYYRTLCQLLYSTLITILIFKSRKGHRPHIAAAIWPRILLFVSFHYTDLRLLCFHYSAPWTLMLLLSSSDKSQVLVDVTVNSKFSLVALLVYSLLTHWKCPTLNSLGCLRSRAMQRRTSFHRYNPLLQANISRY